MWWYLSYATDDEFLGVVVTQGANPAAAHHYARQRGWLPLRDGVVQIVAKALRAEHVPPSGYRDRLLRTLGEVQRAFPAFVVAHARDVRGDLRWPDPSRAPS